jgi:hypothetical protein
MWKTKLSIVLATVCLSLSVDTSWADYWSRDIDDGSELYNRPFQPFLLLVVSSIDDHLRGNAVFMNSHDSPVVLEGTELADGEFWLNATAQVADDVHSEWKTIGQSSYPGKLVSLAIAPKTVNKSILVDLDLFRPMIGKIKHGRVLLKTGEAAQFELEDLLPPNK